MFLVPVNRNLSDLSRSLDRFFDDTFFGESRDSSAANCAARRSTSANPRPPTP